MQRGGRSNSSSGADQKKRTKWRHCEWLAGGWHCRGIRCRRFTHNRVVEIRLLDIRKNVRHPAVTTRGYCSASSDRVVIGPTTIGNPANTRRHRERFSRVVVVMETQTELFVVVLTRTAASRFSSRLNSRQQQTNEHTDDRDDHQQLNKRKTSTIPTHDEPPPFRV